MARVEVLRAAIGSMITGLQTMPSIAWFPLAILLFQLSEQAILFVVVLGAAPVHRQRRHRRRRPHPAAAAAGRAATSAPAGWRSTGTSSCRRRCRASSAGLKQGWAFAWRSLLAGELLVQIANRPSLGQFLNQSREFGDTTYMIALMLVILVIGIVVDAVFSSVDNGIRRRRGVVPTG